MPEWTVLTIPGFSICLIILDISQYTPDIKYARTLNLLPYSYNNIVTNVVLLEFLSAQFVYPGAPQLTILSFLTQVRITKDNVLNLAFLNENNS